MSIWSWDVSLSRPIVGWDLGGAHLKVAVLNSAGRVQQVAQFAVPLWRGLEYLDAAVAEFASGCRLVDYDHVLTMTGELVDLFDSREQGVAELAMHMAGLLPSGHFRLYAGPKGFVGATEAARLHRFIASANWYATAAWLARCQPRGILVDIGSTTTDLLPFRDGTLKNTGYTDQERLAGGELVYTGVVRTPVMAVVQQVPFGGVWLGVANEHFATMGDVYRVLGWLPPDADLHPTADGRDKTPVDSSRRLARMIGADLVDGSERDWRNLAAFIADRQLDSLSLACQRIFSLGLAADVPLVGAGAGRFLAQRLAQRLGRDYIDSDTLLGKATQGNMASAICAPAAAVALLAHAEVLACAC